MHILDYYQPLNLQEALVCLSKSPNTTKIIAGGTDLIIKIRDRSVKADFILDLTKIVELKGIMLENDNLVISSMATFSEIQSDSLINKCFPILAEAAGTIGSPQIRNTATIGGNIVNAAPAADSLAVLLALDAKLKIQKVGAEKIVPLREFLAGINKTTLMADEILTEIIIPLPEINTKMAFVKLARRKALAIARLNLGLTLSMSCDGRIKKAAVAIGAVGVSAYRVTQVEKMLSGKQLDDEIISAAGNLISDIVEVNLGSRPTTSYKKIIARAALCKALENLKADLEVHDGEKNQLNS